MHWGALSMIDGLSQAPHSPTPTAHAAEDYVCQIYEGDRDGPQYAASSPPSLQLLHDRWQEAGRRREAREAGVQHRWSGVSCVNASGT